ncbi:MAG: hypothetical protein AAF846_24020 [Chloroflexota bacterium]
MRPVMQKPKRKRTERNPYLFLVAGIVIGIIGASAIGVLFLFGVSSGEAIIIEETRPIVEAPQPTAVPIEAQGIRPTPIANQIQAATISQNGAYMATISVESGVSHIYLNEIRVEDSLFGNKFLLYQANGYYNDIVFSPDGSKLIATVDNGSALLFDVASRTLIEEYAQIGGAAFTHDNQRLVLVGRATGIRVLDISGDALTLVSNRMPEQTDYTVGAVAINPSNDLAIAFDERVEIFDLDNLATGSQVIEPNNGFVLDLAFHPRDPNTLAIGASGTYPNGGIVQIYDLSNSSRAQYDFGTRVFALAFSPNGEWLAVGGGESGFAESKLIAFRWDAEDVIPPNAPSFYQSLVFEGHEHTIFDVAFTSEGYLLSTAWDGSVRLWELIPQSDAISVYYP